MEFIRQSGGISPASWDWNIPLEGDLNDIYTCLNTLLNATLQGTDWIDYDMLKSATTNSIIDSVKTDIVLPCIRSIKLEFDHTTVEQQAKPTSTARGVFKGFVLPVYNADNEELFMELIIPPDWDGETNPFVRISGWLTEANDEKQFELQLSVQRYAPTENEVVPDDSEDIELVTTTGDWSAYTSFCVHFELDATALGILPRDTIGLRLRRINDNLTGDAITGSLVICSGLFRYQSDKVGSPLP